MIASEVLSRNVYRVPRPELPGVGRFLSQGAAAGAFVYFVIPLFALLWEPYDSMSFLVVLILPFALVWGMLVGLFAGFVIWVSSRLAGRRLNVAVRSALGVVAVVIFAALLYSLLTALGADWHWSDSVAYVVYAGSGVACCLITGSRLQPWRELVRGSEAAKSRILTGVTGLALRALLICGLMESILAVICVLQNAGHRAYPLIVLGHFAIASAIVFVRMKFWLLLPLAVLVNLPTAWLIAVMVKNELPIYRYLAFGYLAIWAAFLLARWSVTYSTLNSLKEELRYYLID